MLNRKKGWCWSAVNVQYLWKKDRMGFRALLWGPMHLSGLGYNAHMVLGTGNLKCLWHVIRSLCRYLELHTYYKWDHAKIMWGCFGCNKQYVIVTFIVNCVTLGGSEKSRLPVIPLYMCPMVKFCLWVHLVFSFETEVGVVTSKQLSHMHLELSQSFWLDGYLDPSLIFNVQQRTFSRRKCCCCYFGLKLFMQWSLFQW